jgi:hypothetical protein
MAESTVSTVNEIPQWAAPAVNQMVGQSMALSQQPYQSYGGQRLEDFNGLQNQSFGAAANMMVPTQNAIGSNVAANAGIAGLNTGVWTEPGTAGNYMSPYMQNVSRVQNEELMRNAEMQRNQNQAQAVQAGAYGGSRHGIVDSEMYRNTMQQMNNNTQTALQNGYNAGMGQFNQDRSAALQGLGVANQSAATLGGLGQQQYQAQTGIANLQNQFGTQQQQLGQQGRDIDYQNFQQQMQWPYQQQNFMNGILRGFDTTQTTATTTQPDPSRTSQIAGAGIGIYGIGKTFGWW